MEIFDGIFEQDQLNLGGGTALTARWKHRLSFDLDFFIHAGVWREVMAKHDQTLYNRLKNHPGIVKATRHEIGYKAWSKDSTIDINPIEYPVRVEPSREVVEGTDIKLESSVEILSRKLHYRLRRGNVVPRDLYDIAVARIVDPDALDAAFASKPTFWGIAYSAIEQEIKGPDWNPERQIVQPAFPELVSGCVQAALKELNLHTRDL